MEEESRKEYWEQVYQTKSPEQVSWTQPVPQTSLDFINELNLRKDARIIDIGGGDSKLVDYLLQDGFTDVTVLDISESALEKAKVRLGDQSAKVKWIVSDITEFQPTSHYDLWHDRATFHFLTTPQQIAAYLNIAKNVVNDFMVIGTFSESGPEKCSGLHIKQYTETQLQEQLNPAFKKIRCINEDHTTPLQTKQNFLFCSFKRQPHLT
ncbi:trans-aconitate 2-methyltransferase [Mucilaginibacter sp.]|jgi:cyclopropane fatty-acyl-phospholipid synthase-like methyltransferase|uniref:class I SAM-dependent methyltransferase n=1 Tax=Mucilaginibacter sp. TaxID=1882438 RepID=UPI003569C6FC